MTPDLAAAITSAAAAITAATWLTRRLRRPHTGTRAIGSPPRPRPATVPRADVKGEPPWPPIVDADPQWLAELAEPRRTLPPPAAPTVAHMLPAPLPSPDWAQRTMPGGTLIPPPTVTAGPLPFNVEFHTSPMLAIAREALKEAGNG